jgi:hypothetical protein
MRVLALPLSALLFLCSPLLAQVESSPAGGELAPDLRIPAVLNKTIRVDKVKPGDEVRLDLVEAILVGHGLVMPEGTHLYGHVLESEPLTASSSSRLSIKVERAEWRHQQLPLHAFISGLGVRKMNLVSRDPECEASSMMSKGAQRRVPTSPSQADCDAPSATDDHNTVVSEYHLQQLKLRTRPDGSTTLFSKEKNIQLPGGTLIMLHNVPASNEGGRSVEASREEER